MDFQKTTNINMDIHDFWMSVPKSVDMNIDIQAGISMQGHSAVDIRK